MPVSRRQLVLVADTTGSMRPCIQQVRKQMSDLILWLKNTDPGVEVAILLHGDYCDYNSTPSNTGYLTRIQPFTDDSKVLQQFLDVDGGTYGGDAPEAYEYVLWALQHQINWATAPNTKKLVVMFGDDEPHPESYISMYEIPGAPERLNWMEEAHKLLELGIPVYAVQCLGYKRATAFWRGVAQITEGKHLQLDQFATAVNLIKAVFLSAQDEGVARVQDFAADLVAGGRMNRNLAEQLSTLTGGAYAPGAKYTATTGELTPCPVGRFQVMQVEVDTPIAEFVSSNGITFRIGRGFYELTKAVLVQETKEVIVQDRVTGDLFEGDAARDILGVPFGTRGKVKASNDPKRKYRVFIQSTSPNRKLLGGTSFLYEVDRTR